MGEEGTKSKKNTGDEQRASTPSWISGEGDSSPPTRTTTDTDSPSTTDTGNSSGKDVGHSGTEDEDEEIRRAKAMALAIKNNPNLNPEQLKQMVDHESLKEDHPAAKRTQSQPLPSLMGLATAFQSLTEGHKDHKQDQQNHTQEKEKEKKKVSVKANFKHLQESIKQTREKARATLGLAPKDPDKKETKKDSPTAADTGTTEHKLQLSRATSNTSEKAKTKTKSEPPAATAKTTINKKEESILPTNTSHSSSSKTDSLSNSFSNTLLGKNPVFSSLLPNPSADDSTQSMDPNQSRLTAVVWKRRSGFGKHSHKAWERRRIYLKGTRVEYYKTDEESEEEEHLKHNSAETEPEPKNWLEQAAINIEKAKANLGLEEDPNAPRGRLDLIKESATVSAASGHSGAPTPFCLSIKVRGETKWKFCFDSHTVQMEWLAALTDVIVQSSVDALNDEPLMESAGNSGVGNFFQPQSQPSPTSNGTEQTREWKMEQYQISAHALNEEDDEENDNVEDEEEDSEMINENQAGEQSRGIVIGEADPPEAGEALVNSKEEQTWIFKERDLYLAFVILNVSVIFSQASSTGPVRFWYVFTFANFGLYSLFSKQDKKLEGEAESVTVGRTVEITTNKKSALKKKRAKRGKGKDAELKPDYKPRAGSTSIKIENPTDVPMRNDHIFAGWRTPPAEDLLVRSHGYISTKKKVPSPGTLYDCVHVDAFESPHRYPDMASRVILPKTNFDDGDKPKTWRAPDIFVISVSLPTDPPSLTRPTEDGGGYTVCMYYMMRQDTRDILRRVTAEDYDPSKEPPTSDIQKTKVNAVKLFDEWCRRAPTDPKFMARFKLIPTAQNWKEIGLPSWIAKYNGKPVLIKRAGQTGFVYNHPEQSCMEFDISLHPFPFLAKQAICYLKDNFFKRFVVSFGFCIEGRSDDELPECLIGLMQLCYPDPVHALQAEDVFSGKAPKSFDEEQAKPSNENKEETAGAVTDN